MIKLKLLFLILFPTALFNQPKATDYIRDFYIGEQYNIDGYGYNKDLPKTLKSEIKDVFIFHTNPTTDEIKNVSEDTWKIFKPEHRTSFLLEGKILSKKVNNYKNLKSKSLKVIKNIPDLKGSLSTNNVIESKFLNKRLVYKIYLPPVDKLEKKLPVIYINDGFKYINKGKMPQLVDSLITNNIIKPVAVVFLSPRDRVTKKNSRQELFLCNQKFVSFFTDELMPEIEKEYPVSNKKLDRSILGLSFGGLAAAYIAFNAPNSFKNIAMQSPAFHPCPIIYDFYLKKPKKDFKIYLSYGTGKDY